VKAHGHPPRAPIHLSTRSSSTDCGTGPLPSTRSWKAHVKTRAQRGLGARAVHPPGGTDRFHTARRFFLTDSILEI